MKAKLSDIHQCGPALERLGRVEGRAKQKMRIARLLKAMISEIRALDEQRLPLLEKHGAKPNETGTTYTFPDTAAAEAFNREWQELLAEEVEMPKPVEFDADQDIAPLTAFDVFALGAFIIVPDGDGEAESEPAAPHALPAPPPPA